MKLLIGSPTWTSWDSHLAIPVSLEIVVAISSVRAPRASPMRLRYLARSSAGVADHASKAALAAATARSTSAAVPAGIVAITSSVTESMTSMRVAGVGRGPGAVDVELVERGHYPVVADPGSGRGTEGAATYDRSRMGENREGAPGTEVLCVFLDAPLDDSTGSLRWRQLASVACGLGEATVVVLHALDPDTQVWLAERLGARVVGLDVGRSGRVERGRPWARPPETLLAADEGEHGHRRSGHRQDPRR